MSDEETGPRVGNGKGCIVCTREELLASVNDFCTDGSLHVQVTLLALQSCMEVLSIFSFTAQFTHVIDPCLRSKSYSMLEESDSQTKGTNNFKSKRL